MTVDKDRPADNIDDSYCKAGNFQSFSDSNDEVLIPVSLNNNNANIKK